MMHRQKVGGVGDFFQDFNFVETVKDYHKDSWEDVLEYIKIPRERDVGAKIARIREEELRKRRVCSLACHCFFVVLGLDTT